jgi:hypothetical protein
MILPGALGEFVGCDDELFPHKLLLELSVLVIADRGPYSFTHTLHRCIVGHGERVINLELLRHHQLYFPVTLTGILCGTILVLEI